MNGFVTQAVTVSVNCTTPGELAKVACRPGIEGMKMLSASGPIAAMAIRMA